VLLVAAADLDLVAMALAGEETGGGSRHLDHRVVGGGRAVHDEVGRGEERLAREALARREQRDAAEHALGLVVRRGRVLVEHEPSVPAGEDQVGEGAAHIDADAVTHRALSATPKGRRATRARLGARPETAVHGSGGTVSASIRRRWTRVRERPTRAAPHRRSDGVPAPVLRRHGPRVPRAGGPRARPPLRPAPAASALACRRQTCGTRAGPNSAAGRRGRRRGVGRAEEPTLAGRNRSHGALAAFGAFSLVASVAAAAWWLGLVPEHATAEARVEEPAVGALLPLDTFIANLADEDGRRYLK